jgi:outer membrane lipoprotein SlyB
MKTVVGILSWRSDAELTVERLREAGIPGENISLLTPDSSQEKLEEVPTTETEQPGMGAAMGGVVGGALGAAGGMGLGAAMATLLVPGVGAVLAIGLGGAALLGAGGAIGGAAAGEALEDGMARGLPIDELFVYEHALRQGRSVLIVFAEDEVQASRAREVLHAAGAESVDAARENWWVGLRDQEKANLSEDKEDKEDFKARETSYRHGFEMALHPTNRGKSYDQVIDSLRTRQPDEYGQDSFRRGYQRGQDHYRELLGQKRESSRNSSA